MRKLYAQSTNLGIPPIHNFSKKTYQAGTQNWEINQDASGRIYIANNEGLLQYDGVYWSLFPVENNTIVRSVHIAGDGRIYVGAQSEFGYFYPKENGQLQYHSLRDLVPEPEQKFADIWDIIELDGRIFFRWDKAIFEYANDHIKTHKSDKAIRALFQSGTDLFLQKENSAIWQWNGTDFVPFLEEKSINSSLKGIVHWTKDTLLFCTLKNGIYFLEKQQLIPWETRYDKLFKEKRIRSANRLHNGNLAISTALNGLLIMDNQKRIIKHLDKANGLQNNNVLASYEDKTGCLWLGLDNGIDCVDLASPFSTIYPDGSLEGTGYAAQGIDGYFYLGVSNGVYVSDWRTYYAPSDAPFFKKVNNTDGQVWNLQTKLGSLWLGHHEGPSIIQANQSKKLSNKQGFWKYVAMAPDYVLAGTYNGLVLFKKTGNTWQEFHRFEELPESCRIMVRDDSGVLWVSHPYRGLYKVLWSPEKPKKIDVTFYDEEAGLPSNLNNYVFSITKKAVFGTEKGVYRFDKTQNRFFKDTLFSSIIGTNRRVSCLQEDTNGNIWFVADKEVGLIEVDDLGVEKTFKKRMFSELTDRLVGGFEMIYPLDANNVFLGSEQGFIHYNPSRGRNTDSLLVEISSVVLRGEKDSTLFGGFKHDALAAVSLASEQNSLDFHFAAPDYQNPNLIQYRTRLSGMEANWSEWSNAHERSYTNLPAGDYSFDVQARRANGKESPIGTYEFSIAPPWYASVLAKIIFVLGVLASWFTFWYWQKKGYESEKAQLTEIHEQKEKAALATVEQTKAALVAAQNEKLQTQIEARNKELALSTMHLVQKGEMLTSIKDKLLNISEISENKQVKKEVQQLLNLLTYDKNLDEDWEHFARHFDRVHVDFLERLREKHPQISSNDQKLCAYLRMNLSTKEIATMMNISVRGVEASRYRLRKRLALSKEINLNEFIMNV